MTLISRFYANANLYAAPKPKRPGLGRRTGRPRVKGRKLAKPKTVVQRRTSRGKRFTVNWYGGGTRRVELIWGEGHWHKAKHSGGPVPVRWVFVHDLTGTHRDEYLFSTDANLAPDRLINLFTARWSIEVTFQELRAHLGFSTLRNWGKKSVLRATPCLLGLFSLVSLIFARAGGRKTPKAASTPWYHKTEPTFSDAIAAVRRACWCEVFRSPKYHAAVTKFPRRLQLLLLEQLCHPT